MNKTRQIYNLNIHSKHKNRTKKIKNNLITFHLDLKQRNLFAEQIMDFIEEGNRFLK